MPNANEELSRIRQAIIEDVPGNYYSEEIYGTLQRIARHSSNSSAEVFDIVKLILADDKKNIVSLTECYSLLGKVVQRNPELSTQIFDTVKLSLAGNKNDINSLRGGYLLMGQLAVENPELSAPVIDTIKQALTDETTLDTTYYFGYNILAKISKSNPELSEKILDTFKQALVSDKNTENSLLSAYGTLGEIAQEYYVLKDNAHSGSESENHPDLSAQALNIIQQTLAHENNSQASLASAYQTLGDIAKRNPTLTEKIPDIIKQNLDNNKNTDHTLATAYTALTDAVISNHALAGQIFEIAAPALSKFDPLDNAFIHAGQTLYTCIKFCPEKTKDLINICLADIEKNGISDLNTFLLTKCMKKHSLDEIVQSHPQHKQILQVAYNLRFSLQHEFEHIFNNMPIEKIAETHFSGQQRCMNILMTQLAKENTEPSAELIVPDSAESFFTHFAKHLENGTEFDKMIICNAKKVFEALKTPEAIQAFYDDNEGWELVDDLNRYFTDEARLQGCEYAKSYAKYIQQHNQENRISYRNAPEQVSLFSSNSDWLIPCSFNANDIFGCYFPSYVKQTEKFLSIHDAVYWLPDSLPKDKKQSYASFVQRNLIFTDMHGKKQVRPLAEMEMISKNWKELTPEQEKLKYADILAIFKSRIYENQTDVKFAQEAAKWGVKEEQYKNYESIYLAGKKVPEPFDSSKEFKFGKYVGRFLPRDDTRTGFFGNYTNCCQHFSGVGRSCANSTIKDPYSQLFVIENENGNIVAGSWVWENTEGKYRDVCFDNIEAIGDYNKNPLINKIYEMAGKHLVNEENCRKVTIGLGYMDADISKYEKTTGIELPKQYNGQYSDAKGTQALLAENQHAEPLDKSKESLRFVREVCFLDIDDMSKVSEKCFPEGDQRLQRPDNMDGLVLVDNDKGIVGYCLYDKDEKSIYDMAVLPEYRTDENASSRKLFAEVVRKIKEIGGEWKGEFREGTSYRYLSTMHQRGLVSFENNGVDHVMSDGSHVYKVKFKINDTRQKSAVKQNVVPLSRPVHEK